MIPRRRLLIGAVACIATAAALLWSLVAFAEEQRTYGTALVSHTVSGVDFTGFEMSYPDQWDTNESGGRACAIQACFLIAPVHLPAGALLKSIEALLCPPNTASDGHVKLLQSPMVASPVILANVSAAGLQGCQLVSATLTPAHTVDNLANTYSLKYESTTDFPPLRTWIQQVRVYYQLQVSPAPAVASFADVPTTHPFFQFVQAFVAAGFTSGCGGGNFCPDATVTRGQLAAFFARGLGLHYAP